MTRKSTFIPLIVHGLSDRAQSCFTDRPALLETMRATADNSFITFSWVDVDDGQGNITQECIRVGFSTQSFYLPKK